MNKAALKCKYPTNFDGTEELYWLILLLLQAFCLTTTLIYILENTKIEFCILSFLAASILLCGGLVDLESELVLYKINGTDNKYWADLDSNLQHTDAPTN